MAHEPHKVLESELNSKNLLTGSLKELLLFISLTEN